MIHNTVSAFTRPTIGSTWTTGHSNALLAEVKFSAILRPSELRMLRILHTDPPSDFSQNVLSWSIARLQCLTTRDLHAQVASFGVGDLHDVQLCDPTTMNMRLAFHLEETP